MTIADVTGDDSGVYQITGSNVAGSDTFTLTVNVYYECMCGGIWMCVGVYAGAFAILQICGLCRLHSYKCVSP